MPNSPSTDLTNSAWELIAPLLPGALPGGRPRTTDARAVLNAIFYVGFVLGFAFCERLSLLMQTADASAKEFLSKWERAWNNHDAHQLCLFHTPDANTVNRHGTLVRGHEALEKALGFLHAVGGPYHDVTAPPLQLIDLRQIAPNVMILQASWKSPVMNPDGNLDLAKQNDLIVSYTLLKEGGDWRATQVDLHNVEKMDLPYSNAGRNLSLVMEARC